MHVHFLDPYIPGKSPLHALDARVKFVLALAFILATALTPWGSWPAYILLFALSLSIVILSGLGVGYVFKRAALALPFVLAAAPLLFTTPGPALLVLPFGALTLAGLEHFASIALKSWLSLQAAIVLAATTPFPELLLAMRAVRLPRLLVALFGLMWRYLFVLADEVLRLMRARAARSGVGASGPGESPGATGAGVGGSVIWRARVTGGMAGNLFLRAFERSDRIYTAMLSRGYDGEVRALPLPPLNRSHGVVLVAGLGILGLLMALGLFMG